MLRPLAMCTGTRMGRGVGARVVPLAGILAVLAGPGPVAAVGVVPRFDHVLVVVMENTTYDVARAQPYTAALITRGAVMTESYAVTHPSQPNYLTLWAGDALGVSTNDCPAPGSPFMSANLGNSCERAKLEWRSYAEALAMAGGAECSDLGDVDTGLYTRKHAPWTDFGNLDHSRERPLTDLALDIAAGQLPALAFVIPDNCHNSHNGESVGCGPDEADAWLASNLPAWIQAVGPRGLVILTWDEDDQTGDNHVLTVLAGDQVLAGASSARHVTHVTILRTILEALGLTPFGATVAESPIDDVWLQPTVTTGPSWGALKRRFP